MEFTDTLLLSIVQGIAEWLPISSSGHLVFFRHLFGLELDMSFDIFLHFSALFVISFFFRKDLSVIFRTVMSKGKNCREYNLLIYILAATLVTGVFGIIVRPHIDKLSSVKTVPFAFFFTSLLLFSSRFKNGSGRITLKKALFIGAFQGLALLPGVSRSGATISAAKIAGAEKEEAFKFSFLAAIPAIAGAVIYEIRSFRMMPVPTLIAGFFISMVLGIASLFILKRVFLRGYFHLFGFYTLAVGLFILMFLR